MISRWRPARPPGLIWPSLPGLIWSSLPGLIWSSLPGLIWSSLPGLLWSSLLGLSTRSSPSTQIRRFLAIGVIGVLSLGLALGADRTSAGSRHADPPTCLLQGHRTGWALRHRAGSALRGCCAGPGWHGGSTSVGARGPVAVAWLGVGR